MEGATAGHILKGFNKERVLYSPGNVNFIKNPNMNITDNLDDEEEMILTEPIETIISITKIIESTIFTS